MMINLIRLQKNQSDPKKVKEKQEAEKKRLAEKKLLKKEIS